jgi:hypothetical protein
MRHPFPCIVATVLVALSFACHKNIRQEENANNESIHEVSSNASTVAAAITPKKFLFDATKAETAGNADWILDADGGGTPKRFPTPAQSGVTAATNENFWTGGISSWGVALVKLGHSVETLPPGTPISFGNASNVQDLKNYQVFVIDEPNILFTAAEKTAILNFVKNGGGLMMISDHNKSDRNNDGFDSPAIWNDLMSNNTAQKNPFGLTIDLNNFSDVSSNITAASSTITNGSQGKVTALQFNNGASITLASGSLARGLIWRSTATQGLQNAMAASSTFGSGRVVVIGDSSPADDGTGNPGNKLFPGWADQNGNHARFHLNASLWLAKLQ